MKKELYANKFLSWNEDGERAIALCDGNGYFFQAINCCRDSDMGEKDENGVYSRIWWSDYIYNLDVEDVRPATKEEVDLFLKYCDPADEEKEMSDAGFRYLGEIEVDGKFYGIFEHFNEPEKTSEVSPAEQKKIHFNEYVNELAAHYKKTGSLKGMSVIRAKYPVQAITREQFYECGINLAAKNGAQLEREFTDKVYEYIKDKKKTKEAPQYTIINYEYKL